MELDVHIAREPGCAWGFTLVGGNDCEIPLTVIKVLPHSPAERAGLQNGDTVLRIDDKMAADMTHARASRAVTAAGDGLVLGVVRGLYDPVLDDYEPLYEPIDQDDLDQPLEPTEVPFKVAEFIEVPPPLDSRSLTASPFVQPTKPYRPFSTEPTDVPPLEEPIILNPNYTDNFPQHEVEDILQIKTDLPPARRFKLRVSEQYDPEGKKIKNLLQEQSKYEETVEFKEEKEYREERRETEVKRKQTEDNVIKQEAEYMEKIKKEIDLERIEMTATEVVEESIQKAVSVAQEIKNEIDVEINLQEKVEKCEIISDVKETKVNKEVKMELKEEKQERKIEVKEDSKVVSELVELIDKTTDEIIKQNETKQEALVEERKMSNKQEIEETIEAGTLRKKSMIFESDSKVMEQRKRSGEGLIKDKHEFQKEEHQLKSEKEKRSNGSQKSTSKLLAEQRAYSIGLQTIPNIRGSTHSSYHYNLLLKTFFIHLTDVMVALTRFILSEPVFSEDTEKSTKDLISVSKSIRNEKDQVKKDISYAESNEQCEMIHKEEVIQKKQVADVKNAEINASTIEKEVYRDVIEKTQDQVKENIISQDVKIDKKQEAIFEKQLRKESDINSEIHEHHSHEYREKKQLVSGDIDEEFNDEEELIEIRRKTGAEMAQMAERKSADLIEKLDAVITEFQAKAGIEETDKNLTVQRRTRSRSRSKVQEQTSKESELLEISKTGKVSHELTEMQTMASSQSRSSYEAKKTQRHHETRELKTPLPSTEDGQIMYVAIVESHVYTNPEAIFEEIATESTETNIAMESMEASKTERVTMEAVRKEEVAQTVIQKAQEMEQKTVEVIQPIQVVEDIKSVQMRQANTVIEATATEIAESSEVTIEEVKDEVLTIKEPPVKSLEVIYEASAKSVAESSEAYVEEAMTEALEITQAKAIQAKEIVETVAKSVAEASEVSIEEIKHEEFKVEEVKTTQAAEVLVENKATDVAEALSVPVQRGKTYDEASAELKIVKMQPVEVEEPVVVISEVELALHKRDVTDRKIYDSVVGVETAVQENRSSIDVSQVASLKSVGETKLDKTVNIEEIEEIPVQVIEKTEVAIEGLNETDTEQYRAALVQEYMDKSNESKAITLQTEVESQSITEASVKSEVSFEATEASFEAKSVSKSLVDAKADVSEVSFEAKHVADASFESESVMEASFEAKSVSTQKQVEKSVEQSYESSISQVIQETKLETSQASIEKKEKEETRAIVERKEEVKAAVVNGSDLLSPPIPETPVTDEYMFKLEIPLPRSRGTTPVPRDCSPPDHEDPAIVKKKLVPHIDTTIESFVYEPPLPTPPPGRELGSPEYKKPGLQGGSSRLKNMRYIKPGLLGGSDRREVSKEELMEIERTSSLLTSAIDKTIKSIEEYKEEVGIEAKKQMNVSSKTVTSRVEHKTVSNGHSNGEALNNSKEVKESYEKEWKEIEEQVKNNREAANELSINVEETNGTSNRKQNKDDRVQLIEVEVSARQNGTSSNGFDKTAETKSENGTKTFTYESNTSNSESFNENGTIEIKLDLQESKSKTDRTETVNKESNVSERVQNGHKYESIEESRTQNGVSDQNKVNKEEEPREDPMQLYRPVKFDPEEIARRKMECRVPIIQEPMQNQDNKPKIYMTETGEIIGSQQGIVDGLEEAVVDSDVAKVLGKPGLPDEKIAELISGEAEMLREAHVMGLARVLSTHMHRDDSSVDFEKIKPVIGSLKDSEVLKALNEEMMRRKEEKKKEERKWTTFLQKPKRPPLRAKFGCYGYAQEEEQDMEPYKVKIVKQPKPKVAPDYKPEDFDTGPLPWEQARAELPPGPPAEPEDPILVPEDEPEFLQAVDPTPESEVPDLEDTGIPLPPPPPPRIEAPHQPEEKEEVPEELDIEAVVEETERIVEDMEGERAADQLLQTVQRMVDPNASLEQQLAQMRAQIAALAQLPGVIQQSLELVARQISQLSQQELPKVHTNEETCQQQQTEENVNEEEEGQQQPTVTEPEEERTEQDEREMQDVQIEETTPSLSQEEARRRRQEEAMMAEQMKTEKQRKAVMEQMKLEHESRQVKQHPTPRVGKPKPMFGPPTPVDRPVVLPGGRKWRRPKDVFDEQMIADVLNAQSEIIQGKVMGPSFESVLLPYDERINFMKYEKPPVNLDHLQRSEVYKVVHDLDETPLKRVETRTPVIAEADYRERVRSISPYPTQKHVTLPQQLQP